MQPDSHRREEPADAIRYAVAPSYLGWVLVAASDRGICAIELGDSREALVEYLRQRFPATVLRADDAAMADWMHAVLAFLEAPQRGLDLPLDIRGTAYQQRVWAALRAIPAGCTISYTELATRLGNPRASRAVASACAANTIAVAIPCHRVVARSGRLAGYRWGLTRKEMLLAREASARDHGAIDP